MKRTIIITSVALVAAIIFVTGCKKEKEEEKNLITITGNNSSSYEFNKAFTCNGSWYSTGPACMGTYHRTSVTFSIVPDVSLWIYIIQPSNGIAGVPVGTFSLVETDCESGFNAGFEIPDGKDSYTLAFSSGTVTVTKSGEEYLVNFNLIIAPASGGGTLKGSYSGIIESTGK